MKKLSFILLLLAMPAFFLTSCKKDEPEPEITYAGPSAASQTVVTVPAGLTTLANTDEDASLALIYMTLANSLSQFAGSFTVPANAVEQGKKSASKIYYWSYQGLSYWMTYSVLADKFTWKYEYQTPELSRFTFIQADELKTKKAGSWTIYDPEIPANEVWTYNWSISTISTFSATLTFADGLEEPSSFEVIKLADTSGNLKYKVSGVLESEITWTSTGSGTYWLRGDGVTAITGSWQ